MNYCIYIDESGNTGNIEINKEIMWNFGIQTHFALGAIYIEEIKQYALKQEIRKILHKYDPNLGDKNELKSKGKYKFKKELFNDLIDILTSYNAGFYIDIANKKYKVIMNMVEYCIYPYYFYNKDEIMRLRQTKINVASDLYNRMNVKDIKTFIDICQDNGEEYKIINKFVEFLFDLKKLFVCYKSDEDKKIINNIEKIIEYTQNYKEKGLKFNNLLPVKDYNNKGSKESFLPNVDAYNNLVAQIAHFGLSKTDDIFIFHDEQTQFSEVLYDWSAALIARGCNIRKLEFCNSNDDILIQICDFFTGNILRLFKDIANSTFI